MIDSKIISAVIQGDPQAFEKVYLQTHDKAYSIAYRVLKDDYEAEDIVQDAYIKMIEQVSQLENPEKLESWFYRIVQNKALDFLRTSHSDTFSGFESEDTDFSFSDTLVSDYTPFDPEASADYAELKRIMDGFVAELPEMQRKCILLRFQQDKKISEIARILGIPESTVKSNLNYGKKKIEGEVRALEKQGVKLYSVTPLTIIPFLRWMWGNSAASAVAAGIGSAGAAEASAAAAATTTVSSSSAAASTAAGTAVKAGAAIGAKQIIAAVCAVAVIGGTAVAAKSEPQPAPAEEAIVETRLAPETTQPETTEGETEPETTEEETVPETTAPRKQTSGQTETQPVRDAESNTFMEPIDFGEPAPAETVFDAEANTFVDPIDFGEPPPAETVKDAEDLRLCD